MTSTVTTGSSGAEARGPADHWPKAAASAVILRGESVLLAERGKGVRAGTWSLPGGHIEPGETAREAARREVREETGLDVDLVGLADIHDVILRGGDGTLRAHYLLAVYYGAASHGEPVAASDCRTARFVPLSDLASYSLTPGAERVIRMAAQLLAGAAVSSAGRGSRP